jgi:hypothetical protein
MLPAPARPAGGAHLTQSLVLKYTDAEGSSLRYCARSGRGEPQRRRPKDYKAGVAPAGRGAGAPARARGTV